MKPYQGGLFPYFILFLSLIMLQKHLIKWVMDEAIHSSDWFYFLE